MRLMKIVVWALIMMSLQGFAQTVPETPFTSQLQWETGAKAMSMGGAFTAVADQVSALYYNPAGLGQLEKTQIFGAFSQRSSENTSVFSGTSFTEESSFTKFDGIGLAMKLPTSQGSMVLGFSYQRTGAFDGALFVEDPNYAIPFSFTDDGEIINLEGSYQGYEWLQEGGLTQTSFGLSVEVAPRVFVGGAVNFWGGEREYTWRYEEDGGIWDDVLDAETGDYFTLMFSDYWREDTYRERYSGANVTLSLLASPISNIQLGAVLKSPVTLKGKRDWSWYEEEWDYLYDETLNDFVDDQEGFYDEEEGYVEHKVQSPWVLRGGLSVALGSLTLAGDVEMHDYSQLKFKTDPPVDLYRSASEANRAIRQGLKNTMNYHLGGEFKPGSQGFALRGGFAHYESPYEGAALNLDRDVYSAGLGFVFSNQILLDAAYAWTEYEMMPGDVLTEESIKASKFLLTLTYQF